MEFSHYKAYFHVFHRRVIFSIDLSDLLQQEARRAREEGERRKRERDYDRRHHDRERYRDRYKRVHIVLHHKYCFDEQR